MNTTENFRNMRDFLSKTIRRNTAIIASLPQGTMNIFIDGSTLRWRIPNGRKPNGQRKYKKINPRDELLAADYAHRMYLENLNDYYKNELKAVNSYLSMHKDIATFMSDYTYQEEYNRLRNLKTGTITEELQKELDKMFILSTSRMSRRTILTQRGEKVRSKSEAIIADELYKRGIPYLYEPIVEVGSIEYKPDFILMDPSTGKLYMWEHLGLLEKSDYACRTFDKFKDYQSVGWILGVNLITTSETNTFPFTGQNASATIDYFLCPSAM